MESEKSRQTFDDWFLFLFLTCVCVVQSISLGLSLREGLGFRPIEFYSPIVTGVLSITIFLYNKKSGFQLSVDRKELLLFVGVFTVTFIFRKYFAPTSSIWCDEDLQYQYSLERAPVVAGLVQHQPPLDMAISRFVITFFGLSEGTVRFSANLFSSVAAGLIAVFSFQTLNSMIVAILFAALFSLHPVVATFGFEARPISLGLTAIILVLSRASRVFDTSFEPQRRQWLCGLGASFLCLIALGLQPPFLLLAMSLGIFIIPELAVQKKIWIVSQWVAAIVLFLPIQIFIFHHAPQRFYRLGGNIVEDILGQYQWSNFAEPLRVYGALIVLAGLLALLQSLRPQAERKFIQANVFFFVVFGFFLSILIPFFKAEVRWTLFIYYIVFAWPVSIFAFIMAVAGSRALRRPRLIGVILLLVIPFILLSTQGAYRPIRGDFRSVAHYIKSSDLANQRLALLQTCIFIQSGYCTTWPTGANVYLGGEGLKSGGKLDFAEKDTLTWWSDFLKLRLAQTPNLILEVERWLGPADFQIEWPLNKFGVEHKPFFFVDVFIIRGEGADAPRDALKKLVLLLEALDQLSMAHKIETTRFLDLMFPALQTLGESDRAAKIDAERSARLLRVGEPNGTFYTKR